MAGAHWASLVLGLVFCLTATAEGAPGAGSAARVREFGSPLLFEPNQGQTAEGVEYLARGDGYRLYLRGNEAVLALAGGPGPRHSVRLRLVDAASRPEALGLDRRPSVSHYLIGADPSLWRRNVPHYGQVEYRDVYPGVSLVYYGREGALEYDFVLAAGADPEAIRFEVEGASIRVDDAGNLVLTTPEGDLLQRTPVLYQESPEGRAPVQGQFVLHGSNRVGFRVSDYDRSKALVIDPVLTWSRFHGGRFADHADGVAVDTAGFIYVTGQTASDNFPAGGPLGVVQPFLAGPTDAFVTKFRPDGAIVWSTYLGGGRDDFGTAIAVDRAGQTYVTGWTESDNFPVKLPLPGHGALSGPRDAFVSKLDRDGANLLYSTYLGGLGSDEANGIAVDPTQVDGEAVVVGVTDSTAGFPLVNALQPGRFGPTDAFITRFKAPGDSLIFSTFWGGKQVDKALAVALFFDLPVVVGGTNSDDFPVKNEQQGWSGLTDAFVSMLLPDGSDVIFSTYLGGSKDEAAFAVATDPTGFFIGGQTFSGDFPVRNPVQGGLRGTDDGFITKLNRTDFKIVYSTFLGGRLSEKVAGLGVDSKGYLYAAGSTTSDNFPLVDPLPIGTTYRGNSDVFVAKLAPSGCTLTYSTYLGSDGTDLGNALALGGDGTAYVVGQAGSGFPVNIGPGFGPPSDGFVLRIDDFPSADLKIVGKTATPDPVPLLGTLTYTMDVENLGPSGAFNVVFKDTLDSQVAFLGASPASCFESAGIVTCPLGCMDAGQVASITIQVLVGGGPLLTNIAEVTTGEDDPGTPNTVNTLTSVLTADLEVTKTGPATAPVGGTFTYQVTVTNHGPDLTTGIIVQDLLPTGTTFVSASGIWICVEGGGVVDCTDPLPLLSGGSSVFTIDVKAAIPGLIVNTVAVSGPDFDPNPFNNTDEWTTVVGTPTGGLQFFTATATDHRIFLEWKNPAAAPYNSTKILYRFVEGSSFCTFPTGPADGGSVELVNDGTAGIGGHGTFLHPAIVNDTTYCFAAFVQKDAAGTLFSGPLYVRSRPFDTSGPVKWAYSTGGAMMAPPSYGSAGMFAASGGDQVLHSMVRGDGLTGGHWPPSWTPLALGGPAQSRHPVILAPSLIAGSPELVLLGVQDGTARAVDAVTGQEKWQQLLGPPMVQAALAGIFQDFGGAWDYGLVGTRDGAGDNKFFALNPKIGIPVNSFNNAGGANGIGIISGGAAVDYPGHRVYFASRKKFPGPGSNGTLWCLTLTPAGLGGLCPGVFWPVDLGDIDGSPILRNGIIYVGDNLGRVHAVNPDGSLAWAAPFITGDGPVKGFIFPDRTGSALYFATTNNVWGIVDLGASASLTWFTPLAPGAGPPTPSIVLWNPGTTKIYVGGSDGQLYQIDFSTVPSPPVVTSVLLGDGLAVVGAPTLDRLTGFVYVGSDAGIIYAVQTPLP